MLVLSRKKGEQLVIGRSIELTVLAVSGRRVTLGICGPREVQVIRGELSRRTVPPVSFPETYATGSPPAEPLDL